MQDVDVAQIQERLARLFARVKEETVPGGSEQEFMDRVLGLCLRELNAEGGAVWLIERSGQKAQLTMVCHRAVEKVNLDKSESQRQNLFKAVEATVKEKRTLLLAPMDAMGQNPGTGAFRNESNRPIICAPIRSEDDCLGAFLIWPFEPFTRDQVIVLSHTITAFCVEFGPRLLARRLREHELLANRLRGFFQCAQDISGLLEPAQAARVTTAHVRDLTHAKRCSLLIQRGRRWEVLGISGQETISQKSEAVAYLKTLAARSSSAEPAFIAIDPEEAVANDGDAALTAPLPGAPAANPGPLENEERVCMIPLLDPALPLVASMICEFPRIPPAHRSAFEAQVLATAQTLRPLLTRAVAASRRFSASAGIRRLSDFGLWLSESSRGQKAKRLTLLGCLTLLPVLILAFPVPFKVEGDCTIQPRLRGVIAAPFPGRIETVLLREGDPVKKGQPVIEMDTSRVKTELETAIQQEIRSRAEAERQRGMGDEAMSRISSHEADATAARVRGLRTEIELSVLRSPLDGVIVTKDLHLLRGEILQIGQHAAEVATADTWDLKVMVRENDVTFIRNRIKENAKCSVRFLLYSLPGQPIESAVVDAAQISASAHAEEKKTYFQVTLPALQLPASVSPHMRPGLTGRAKLRIGTAPLGYTLFRDFYVWIRTRWFL